MNIRKEIASRLKYEFRRRAVNGTELARQINLSPRILERYLEGKRELNMAELTAICDELSVNPVRLLYTTEYPESKLSFRHANKEMQQFASRIEDAFLTIIDVFEEIDDLPIYTRATSSNTFEAVALSAAKVAKAVFKKYKYPTSFIQKHNIPVLFISAGANGFDGFLISCHQRHAFCINKDKPPHRIFFTLAHEISHLLFDLNLELPVDVLLKNLYKETYDPQDVPEFFAYKFAQFFILPFHAFLNHVNTDWLHWDKNKIQEIINNRAASVDVLVNVVNDIFRIKYSPELDGKLSFQQAESNDYENGVTGAQLKRFDQQEREDIPWYKGQTETQKIPSYVQIKQYCQANFRSSNKASGIYDLLEKRHLKIAQAIHRKKNDYSQQVFDFAKETLQLELP